MRYRSWFSRMERQFPKLEPVNIRVTWIDGETIYIKRMAPVPPHDSKHMRPDDNNSTIGRNQPTNPSS